MPKRHEREYNEEVSYSADLGLTAPAEGDVEVSNNPAVERAVPRAPEGECAVVVAHAPEHVFWGIDAVEKTPETEETPGDEEFEPDVVQAEVAEHAELHGCVLRPVWGGFGDCDCVDVVLHYFHSE